jgi:sugar lactone lactonase YvrE
LQKNVVSTAFADQLGFPEGPRWKNGRLWLSDMHQGLVLRFDTQGNRTGVLEVPEQPSGLGFLPDGRLLVVSMRDRRLLRLDPEGPVVVADLSALVPGDLNDMVVDERGRAYIGNFGYDSAKGEAPRPTCLVLVTPEGETRVAADELAFPNGTVILPGNRSLVVAETLGERLTAFDIEEDGSLVRRRVFAELPGRMPDGIAADAEGAIWVSCFSTDEFLRVRPGGEITHRIAVQGRRAVACALGGEQRRTLFLLTAETTAEALERGISRGFVEQTRVEIGGAGIP